MKSRLLSVLRRYYAFMYNIRGCWFPSLLSTRHVYLILWAESWELLGYGVIRAARFLRYYELIYNCRVFSRETQWG